MPHELTAIHSALHAAIARGTEAVLATIVRVGGSTYRRPGARMLLTRDGVRYGAISGGCLEKEVAKRAWWLTESSAALAIFDTRSGEEAVWEFGLGCQGVVNVLLERIAPPELPAHLHFVDMALQRTTSGVLARVFIAERLAGVKVGAALCFEGARLVAVDGIDHPELTQRILRDAREAHAAGRSRTCSYRLAGGAAAVFLEVIQPRLPLWIFGGGFDVLPLTVLASSLGWSVTVIDPRGGPAAAARFPHADRVLTRLADLPKPVCSTAAHSANSTRSADSAAALPVQTEVAAQPAAVLMTHNLADDLAVLRCLAQHELAYLGILGPRSRSDALVADLQAAGLADWWQRLTPRVHAPIGLDLGAETPEQIALAITAEILACRAGHVGGFLRDRAGPIHKPAADDADLRSAAPAATYAASARACPIQSD